MMNLDKDPRIGQILTEDEAAIKKCKEHFYKKFPMGNSERLNRMLNDIRIVDITSNPVVYAIGDIFYEEREIGEERIPSSYVSGMSDTLHKASEYNQWAIEINQNIQNFTESYTKQIIEESKHVSQCFSCNANGYKPCNCRGGYVTCKNCAGRGDVRCGRCGGQGDVRCSACGGVGRTSRTEQRYDNDNYPYLETIEETCYSCGGSGIQRCGSCGGSGLLVCNSCRGSGEVVCSTCNGTQRVTCRPCNGLGYFCNQVYVTSKHDTKGLYDVIDSRNLEFISASLNQQDILPEVTPSDEDLLICSFESKDRIDAIVSEEHFGDERLDFAYMMDELEEWAKSQENINLIKYRVRLFQRNVYEYVYHIGENDDKEYIHIFDDATGDDFILGDPVKDFENIVLTDVDSFVNECKYKSFITSENDLTEVKSSSLKDIKKKHSKLGIGLIKKSLIVPAILFVVSLVIRFVHLKVEYDFQNPISIGSILLLIIECLLGAGAIYYLWPKYASDDKKKTCIISQAIALVIGIIIRIIFHSILL